MPHARRSGSGLTLNRRFAPGRRAAECGRIPRWSVWSRWRKVAKSHAGRILVSTSPTTLGLLAPVGRTCSWHRPKKNPMSFPSDCGHVGGRALLPAIRSLGRGEGRRGRAHFPVTLWHRRRSRSQGYGISCSRSEEASVGLTWQQQAPSGWLERAHPDGACLVGVVGDWDGVSPGLTNEWGRRGSGRKPTGIIQDRDHRALVLPVEIERSWGRKAV